jgi:hypothetical protein
LAGSLPADNPDFNAISSVVETTVGSVNHGVASILRVTA